MFKKSQLVMGLAFAASVVSAASAIVAEPKIAVTDLTYEEKVSEYFRVVSATSKSSVKASGSERETDYGYSNRGRVNAKQESTYNETEGVYTYIDRGELR